VEEISKAGHLNETNAMFASFQLFWPFRASKSRNISSKFVTIKLNVVSDFLHYKMNGLGIFILISLEVFVVERSCEPMMN
jgi:hypothetical protein